MLNGIPRAPFAIPGWMVSAPLRDMQRVPSGVHRHHRRGSSPRGETSAWVAGVSAWLHCTDHNTVIIGARTPAQSSGAAREVPSF